MSPHPERGNSTATREKSSRASSPDDAIVAAYRNLEGSRLDGRLIMTPHSAWSSPESAADARRLAVETAMIYLREGRLRNLVNGDFLTKPRG